MADHVEALLPTARAVADEFVRLGPDRAYCIADFADLRPFLVSVVSDCDLWMYLSSTGALTAGRGNEDRALFPYETDDKLHQLGGVTGPRTLLRVRTSDRHSAPVDWQPFAATPAQDVRRRLYKTVLGNHICFEEVHETLGLTFRYTWQACDAFGWVRTCELESSGEAPVHVEVLDGVVNLLPAHAELATQRAGSCLINAYTQCELDVPSGLAILSLASRITDRAEPCEALYANTAFQVGLVDARTLLSTDQVNAFIDGEPVTDEHLLTGRRGAFLVVSRFELRPDEARRWYVAIDAHRTQAQVAELRAMLQSASAELVAERIERSLHSAHERLAAIVASADGQQRTADEITCAHHASNVLFNNLRGGVFLRNEDVPSVDFAQNLRERNRAVAERHAAWLGQLPEVIGYDVLLAQAAAQRDPQLVRLAMEYLPLTFGRRHGDPSRPWNRFDIRVANADGSPALSYQGNWRDIFQNWEALVHSFPGFAESLVAKFVNASTLDGFNPYRVTRQGIEWEVPDPHDPWSHIGYWGDHQIIYLLKLLEASTRFHRETIGHLLSQRLFAYADVPYRLRPYAALLADRRNTIDFDFDRHRQVSARLASVGTDARLVHDGHGEVLLVTLAEKLLVPALAKLSNLIPGCGIWMNTQRPEWNDANNALVGNGVSVVTLCYLRRYVAYCVELFGARETETFDVRTDVSDWLERLAEIFATLPTDAAADVTKRKTAMDALGLAFESYRMKVYERPSVEWAPVAGRRLAAFFADVLRHLDESIRHNRRRDDLYHAYNLLTVTGDAVEAGRLPVMLEGQVAVLSSGLLGSAEAADVVERLFTSDLWREDQQSFMLYPIRELPGFLQKNSVDEMAARRSVLAHRMLQADCRAILHRDVTGQIRFNAEFRSQGDVQAALLALAEDPAWRNAVAAHGDELLALYEQTFAHHAFTGRSGSMYGYEGIGCIYWHMVAKLLLAVQENVWRAVDTGEPDAIVQRLAACYDRVRFGLGFNKSAREYGAFPLDAYSHTPLHAGAQQPGMTGQVKEEILTRLGELGVRVHDGLIRFAPVLLRADEFIAQDETWCIVDVNRTSRTIHLPAGSLGFTLAGTPIVYQIVETDSCWIDVCDADGSSLRIAGNTLDANVSRRIMTRDGSIDRIEVGVPLKLLRSSPRLTPKRITPRSGALA